MGAERLDWQHRGDYIRQRSGRHDGDTNIEPSWADEAFTDSDALLISPDPASKSARLTASSATRAPRRWSSS